MSRWCRGWSMVAVMVFAVGCPAGGPREPGTDGGSTDDAAVALDASPGLDAGGETDAGPEPTCDDGVRNGPETDVDCGGNSCMPCAVGEECESGPDCASAVCTGGVCAAASCTDAAQNQDETDVDCGGATCDPCADGGTCVAGTDCESGVCDATSSRCVGAGCADGRRNGTETDVDCGGTCAACAVGLRCTVGSDCASGYCSPSMTCAVASCMDGLLNQDETDVDCGGVICTACPNGSECATGGDCTSLVCDPLTLTCLAASCSDGVLNAGETSVDCGGGACPPCATGAECDTGADCASGVCFAGRCGAASCTDSVQNGAETGVDCGGGCPGCATGAACTLGTDCASGICDAASMTCVAPTCTDGVRNGAETGADCGGGTCPGCPAGEGCRSGADCATGVCDPVTLTCSTPGCTDGVQNGAERGVDCGGGTCPGCVDGTPCGAGADCASGVCDPTTMACAAPTCVDGLHNGIETDVDCGGGACPRCLVGEGCRVGMDCSTDVCGVATRTCSAPTCTDGVLNGGESDVDCGGARCGACGDGDDCNTGSDCTSGVCAAGRCARPTCSDGVQNGGEGGIDCDGPCPACIVSESTIFPATGDPRVASGGLYFWRLNDYVTGTRTLSLPSVTRMQFTLQIDPNVLGCDTQDVQVSLNGRVLGTIAIAAGNTSVSRDYTFPAVAGPTYTIRIQTIRQVASGCGSAGYPENVSTFTLYR